MTAYFDIETFIILVFKEGVISTLQGLPGGGKSNFATKCIEWAVERGFNIYTNLGFFDLSEVLEAMEKDKLARVKDWKKWYRKTPPEVHTVRSLSELFIGLLTTENNIVILDEAGFQASSKRATGKSAVNWEYVSFIIRHLSSAFMLIVQVKRSLTPALREDLIQFELKVRKLSRSDRMLTIGTAVEVIDEFTGESFIKFEVAEGDEYHFMPMARYPYDGKDFPYFDMDLDLIETFKRLSQAGNSLKIRRTKPGHTKPIGVEIIEELVEESNSQKGQQNGYLKVGAYAKKYGLSQPTVRRLCDEGIIDSYTTDSGYRMIADKPPKHK